MKALLAFFFPTFKAFVHVIAFMFTIVSLSYVGIVAIAKTEAKTIEDKVLAVRKADMEHLNKRFDTLETLIRELK